MDVRKFDDFNKTEFEKVPEKNNEEIDKKKDEILNQLKEKENIRGPKHVLRALDKNVINAQNKDNKVNSLILFIGGAVLTAVSAALAPFTLGLSSIGIAAGIGLMIGGAVAYKPVWKSEQEFKARTKEEVNLSRKSETYDNWDNQELLNKIKNDFSLSQLEAILDKKFVIKDPPKKN